MHLVQMLLPLRDNAGATHPSIIFDSIVDEMTKRFGGVTAYGRAPAQGLWSERTDEKPKRDDLIVFEVMVDSLDAAWWTNYRSELHLLLRQKQTVVRAIEMKQF